MRRRAIATALVLGLAAAGCGGGGETTQALPEGRFMAVSSAVEPKVQLFADPVVVRMDVLVDTERYDPDRVRVVPDFEPFEIDGEPVRVEKNLGRYANLHYEFTIRCYVYECLPEVGGGPPQPDPVTGIVPTTEGGFGERKSMWLRGAQIVYSESEDDEVEVVRRTNRSAVQVVTRLNLADTTVLGVSFPFEASVTPLPGITYRIPPAVLGGGLIVAALALLAFPALLVARATKRRPAPVQVEERERTPLEQALALVEWARSQRDPERREALEALARELEAEGSELDARTRRLAWSPASPSSDAMGELVRTIEAEHGAATSA